MKARSGLKIILKKILEKKVTYFPDSNNAGPVYESSIFISLKSGKGSSVFSSPNKDKINHKSLYNIRCTISKNIVPFRLILFEVKGHFIPFLRLLFQMLFVEQSKTYHQETIKIPINNLFALGQFFLNIWVIRFHF